MLCHSVLHMGLCALAFERKPFGSAKKACVSGCEDKVTCLGIERSDILWSPFS